MDTSRKLGLREHVVRRNAAWTAMLKAAERQHAVNSLTARRIKTDPYAMLYGDSITALTTTHGVKAKTIGSLRTMLGLLFDMAERNGSPVAEVFQRFEDYSRAERRTHSTRCNKARLDSQRGEADAYLAPMAVVFSPTQTKRLRQP